jgi:hypothetical protein
LRLWGKRKTTTLPTRVAPARIAGVRSTRGLQTHCRLLDDRFCWATKIPKKFPAFQGIWCRDFLAQPTPDNQPDFTAFFRVFRVFRGQKLLFSS